MKSLLVFLPQSFINEQPGCMYGNIIHNVHEDISKFYVLGLTDSLQTITRAGNDLVNLGYFYGLKKKEEYWEKKFPNWIEICLCTSNFDTSTITSTKSEFCIRNIILQNQKLTQANCHTVIIIYDEYCLLHAELLVNKIPIDHFTELKLILKKEQVRKNQEKLQKLCLARLKELIFIFFVSLFLYPIKWLCSLTDILHPILKYSALGLHVSAWLQNVKWILTTLWQCGKFTLSIKNFLTAMLLDMFFGLMLLKVLLHFLQESSPSEVYLYYAESVVESLKGLVNWLMGSPAGLKLNPSFNGILGKFFLYHIHLWWVFLMVTKPLMELAFEVLIFIGRLGVTFQISIVADLLALVSFHTYCIYVYAARLYNIQLRGLTALFRLFLGKKKNPLRERVDTCRYQPDQLFVGTLLFTVLLFLMPTTWVYYIVFTVLRLIMIGLGGLLTRLKFYLQIFPIYIFTKWLFQTVETSGSIGIRLQHRKLKGPITLVTKTITSSWSTTWRKSIPDTITIHPAIKWSSIANSVIWGQLLYPL